jgi:N-acetylglucosaminyldiphosphoundecaprenol N-acetyl-beta-D-mannosaminyltransferase
VTTSATTPVVPHTRIYMRGVPVDAMSLDQVEEDLCRRIRDRIKTHVVFINAAKVVGFSKDHKLQGAITRAGLSLADGVPIVWASRLYGNPLPGRVNGTDLMERLVSRAAREGFRVFLLGGTKEIVHAVAEEFKRRSPGLKIVGIQDGYFSDSQNDEIVARINESRADILLVGMSTPRKETWADETLHALNVSVCQGVGGSFDVVAGHVSRAPRWMQRFGLEWFYRFLQEPRRMGPRYLITNPLFVKQITGDVISFWRKRIFSSTNVAETSKRIEETGHD